jgi:hypothetical protein
LKPEKATKLNPDITYTGAAEAELSNNEDFSKIEAR